MSGPRKESAIFNFNEKFNFCKIKIAWTFERILNVIVIRLMVRIALIISHFAPKTTGSYNNFFF